MAAQESVVEVRMKGLISLTHLHNSFQDLRNEVEGLERIAAAADAIVKEVEARNRPLVEQLKVIRDQMTKFKERQREIEVRSLCDMTT